jgi:cytochrome c-type biogenesis protein
MKPVTLLIIFLAGLLSFLSPCILALAPAYLSIITGISLTDLQAGVFKRRTVVLATVAFIIGFTLIFIAFGASSSLIGSLLRSERRRLTQIGGILVIIFGLHQTGLLPIKWFYQERKLKFQPQVGIVGAFLAGIGFSLGWTPCVGPILGSILAIAGTQGEVTKGMFLLLIYSLGMAIPFLILALGFEHVARGLQRIRPLLKYLEWIAGGLLIIMGILLVTGSFTVLNTYIMRITGGWSPENLLKWE